MSAPPIQHADVSVMPPAPEAKVPVLALALIYTSLAPYALHCITHFCACGHIAHEPEAWFHLFTDLAWLGMWSASMLLVARRPRKGNLWFHVSLLLTGLMSYVFSPLGLFLIVWPLGVFHRIRGR
jgi:hypothetical protein